MTEPILRVRVLEAKRAAEKEGKKVLAVQFTAENEEEIALYGISELGPELAKQITLEGVRVSIPTFLGFPITWDAPEFKVVVSE